MLRRLEQRRAFAPGWLAGLLPVALVGVAVGVFLVRDPIAAFRGRSSVEQVAFERTVFFRGGIRLEVRNDGPAEVTIAQVMVNEAFWNFAITRPTLGRLETTTIDIPYPWQAGQPVSFQLISSSGATAEHRVEAAALTPQPDGRWLRTYALLGTFIGLLPVAIGLLWLPALRHASDRLVDLVVAFTLGLLGFLLIDTVSEGLEFVAATAEALDGLLLFTISGLAAAVGLAAVGDLLGRRASSVPGAVHGLGLAYLIAIGIGLHNAGEGVAVGSALAAGEVALGTFLVVGFTIHNATEGLAIVAPLRVEVTRPVWWHFPALALLAGGPATLGALAGGFALSPVWATIAFGVAAGTVAQVLWTVGRSVTRHANAAASTRALGFVAGLAFMYATGLLTA